MPKSDLIHLLPVKEEKDECHGLASIRGNFVILDLYYVYHRVVNQPATARNTIEHADSKFIVMKHLIQVNYLLDSSCKDLLIIADGNQFLPKAEEEKKRETNTNSCIESLRGFLYNNPFKINKQCENYEDYTKNCKALLNKCSVQIFQDIWKALKDLAKTDRRLHLQVAMNEADHQVIAAYQAFRNSSDYKLGNVRCVIIGTDTDLVCKYEFDMFFKHYWYSGGSSNDGINPKARVYDSTYIIDTAKTCLTSVRQKPETLTDLCKGPLRNKNYLLLMLGLIGLPLLTYVSAIGGCDYIQFPGIGITTTVKLLYNHYFQKYVILSPSARSNGHVPAPTPLQLATVLKTKISSTSVQALSKDIARNLLSIVHAYVYQTDLTIQNPLISYLNPVSQLRVTFLNNVENEYYKPALGSETKARTRHSRNSAPASELDTKLKNEITKTIGRKPRFSRSFVEG